MNQLLGNNDVTVTLQWPQEAGAVYHVNVLPENFISHTPLTVMSNNTITKNLTISYNIQYNVSIVTVSSPCNVSTYTIKELKYGRYG